MSACVQKSICCILFLITTSHFKAILVFESYSMNECPSAAHIIEGSTRDPRTSGVLSEVLRTAEFKLWIQLYGPRAKYGTMDTVVSGYQSQYQSNSMNSSRGLGPSVYP